MSLTLALVVLLFLLVCSAVFSGAETGVYSISQVRLEAEAKEGRRTVRILAGLLRDDAGLLITLLVGSTLAQDLATLLFESRLASVPPYARELVTTAALTPVLFLFGELLPKDLFRLRPHLLLGVTAPFLSFFRWVSSPVVWPLTLAADGVERLLGLRREERSRVLRREEMLDMLAESARSGLLAPHAEELAKNVLVLRHTPLIQVSVPWERVERVHLDRGEAEAHALVMRSSFTRLPVVGSAPNGRSHVLGYVHQLDLLGAQPGTTVESVVRPILVLDPELPLDRAVARLQLSGQRLALVGTASAPRGLVTLMDLLATIASRQPRFSQPGATARIGTPA